MAPEHRGHVVVRLAGVDHRRLAGLAREAELGLERLRCARAGEWS